ncbi:nuclear transport factor 2 family protein [Pedobacter sp. GR22-6]|uniref:nuclear transport factor 2 family protein n=1 Tax=Pedobacter sp. GR22-6 TaxID=3127957 RepID=UPI00307D896B
MENLLAVARLFSGGKFDEVSDRLAHEVEFHIYEDQKHLIGKAQVLEFCKGIADYFSTIDTDFRESGSLVGEGKVVIYGYGEFKKDGQLVNAVHSCDVYEFNDDGMIAKIHSYCNSGQQ